MLVEASPLSSIISETVKVGRQTMDCAPLLSKALFNNVSTLKKKSELYGSTYYRTSVFDKVGK